MNRGFIALLIVTFSLTGCGIAAKVNARNDMEQSKVAYKACLAEHPQDVSFCKGAKAAYEADMQSVQGNVCGYTARSKQYSQRQHGR